MINLFITGMNYQTERRGRKGEGGGGGGVVDDDHNHGVNYNYNSDEGENRGGERVGGGWRQLGEVGGGGRGGGASSGWFMISNPKKYEEISRERGREKTIEHLHHRK